MMLTYESVTRKGKEPCLEYSLLYNFVGFWSVLLVPKVVAAPASILPGFGAICDDFGSQAGISRGIWEQGERQPFLPALGTRSRYLRPRILLFLWGLPASFWFYFCFSTMTELASSAFFAVGKPRASTCLPGLGISSFPTVCWPLALHSPDPGRARAGEKSQGVSLPCLGARGLLLPSPCHAPTAAPGFVLRWSCLGGPMVQLQLQSFSCLVLAAAGEPDLLFQLLLGFPATAPLTIQRRHRDRLPRWVCKGSL